MTQLETTDTSCLPLLDLATSACLAPGLRTAQRLFTVLDPVGLVAHPRAHTMAQ